MLVTGDLPAEKLEELAASLRADSALDGVTVTAAQSVTENAAAVSKALAADAIVLAVECGRSTYANVNEQKERLQALGKDVLGCIVYE